MLIFLEIILLAVLAAITSAYDPIEGILQQMGGCFEEVLTESGCNVQLSDVFSPPYKGVNINEYNTKFFLFTVKNQDKAEPLHKCGGRLPSDTTFDPDAETIIICHGWIDGVCRTAWMREMKHQLFIRGKYNIILVDWTWGNAPDLISAALNAMVTGEEIAFLILNIMDQTGMTNGDKFHLIAHSYGTHAVSAAGKYILERYPEKIVRRMSLLDPAIAPLKNDNPYNLINTNNSKFMDVIHADGGECAPINAGFFQAVGDVDFYPNGGGFQLGCYSYLVTAIEQNDFVYAFFSLFFPQLCSHLHAIQYFKVSINHPQGYYIGAECDSYESFLYGGCKRCCKGDGFSQCAVMGMDAERFFNRLGQPKRNRTYYLAVGFECPYNEDYEFSIYKDC